MDALGVAMEHKNICCLRDLIEAFTEASRAFGSPSLWWRGEADASWPTPLIPKIYRGGITRESEKGRLKRFRLEAPPRHQSCPNEEDYSAWLFLMQHHGLATRLLDWTESPLVATFFALKEPEKQGSLWVLEPMKLNRAEFNVQAFLLENDDRVKAICKSAFEDDVENADRTVAVLPKQITPRMTNQYSVFTIHGSRNPLKEHPEKSKFLDHFNIPAKAKDPLRSELYNIGIRLSILFPDLDHLAEHLNSLEYRI
jgi:hypothetical protein